MTLPVSGTIKLSEVNVELGRTATSLISMNETACRSLAGVPGSGTTIRMSDFYGKSAIALIPYVISSNSQQLTINISAQPGYSAGKTVLQVTVNPGIYVWSDDNTIPAINITGGTTGDTITLVNNGFIMGKGGNAAYNTSGANYVVVAAQPGGTALNISRPITITNASGYIGGGGGGGGTSDGGGGGAGGGQGNGGGTYTGGDGGTVMWSQLTPAAGGSIGSAGANGTRSGFGYTGGGGGGRIMPGTGGAGGAGGAVGTGGGAGGGGSNTTYAGDVISSSNYTGGGGGWGAAGGATVSSWSVAGAAYGGSGGSGSGAGHSGGATNTSGTLGGGGAGGKAINTNGNAVSYVSGSGRVYGIVG